MIYYICIMLLLFIAGQAIIHFFERKDLYNRIMSRDIFDYEAAKSEPHDARMSAHRKALEQWKHKGDETK